MPSQTRPEVTLVMLTMKITSTRAKGDEVESLLADSQHTHHMQWPWERLPLGIYYIQIRRLKGLLYALPRGWRLGTAASESQLGKEGV